MDISRIRPYEGYYDNSIDHSVENFSIEKMQSAKPESVQQPKQTAVQAQPDERELAKAREKQTFGAVEYADTYQPGKEYSLKGADSDIRSLDVQKAVSDMQKDEVLHQYQFFVGHSATGKAENPIVPTQEIEDFSLK